MREGESHRIAVKRSYMPRDGNAGAACFSIFPFRKDAGRTASGLLDTADPAIGAEQVQASDSYQSIDNS